MLQNTFVVNSLFIYVQIEREIYINLIIPSGAPCVDMLSTAMVLLA